MKRQTPPYQGSMKNTLRNMLLLVLALLLFVFTVMTWNVDFGNSPLITKLLAKLSIEDGGYVQRVGETTTTLPVSIAMTRADGVLIGASYNSAAVGALYEAARPILARALSGAQEFSDADDAALRDALTQNTLMIAYDSSLPLTLLTKYAGAQRTEKDPLFAGSIVLTQAGALYVRDGSTGALYSASAPIELTEWQAAQALLPTTVCTYASQDAQMAMLFPETLLTADPMAYSVLKASPPTFGDPNSGDSMQTLLEAFGYSAYVQSYTEDNGTTQVFVENYGTLRVHQDGTVDYRASSVTEGLSAYQSDEYSQESAFAAQLDFAQRLLDASLRAIGTTAPMLQLKSITQGEQEFVRVLEFGLSMSGVPIYQASGSFARLEFHGRMLVSARMRLRRFSTDGEMLYVLPPRQTAATGNVEQPRRYRIAYLEKDEGRLLATAYLQ